MRFIQKLLSFPFLVLIKVYQLIISPYLGPNCRHIPTCSHYTAEAIKTYGPFKGIWLGLKRISKCHPWGTSGYDPVPPKE
ncbi:MAG: membrane protein insertion efficiency factor YidD [Flavobacteriales bacterium]|nr:membrane protein insertion efficiency factor YidD [Flavobacteriales bacterium]